MAEEKNELVKVSNEAALALMQDQAGTGFEGTSGRDYAIPLLTLLQKNSPQCDPDSGKYLPEAKSGLFFDTGLGICEEVVKVIPCLYRSAMVEWVPRESGGGFVASHEVGFELKLQKDDRGRFLTENGNLVVDTRYMCCLKVDGDGDVTPVIIPFASTQIKKVKSWMSRMEGMKLPGKDGKKFKPPMFSFVWTLSSIPEQNDKGSWRGYKIDLVGPVDNPVVLKRAMETREMFQSSAMTITPPEETVEPEPASASANKVM
jgi:hypothetical protein